MVAKLFFIVFVFVFIIFSIVYTIILSRIETKYFNINNKLFNFQKFNQASKLRRCSGFIIDVLVFSLCEGGLSKVINKCTGNYETGFMFYVLLFLLHVLYFAGLEFQNGKTCGKMLMGTKVIQIDAQPLSIKCCLIRYCCRWIPFDAVSFIIGRGWHDTFSKTIVVIDNKSFNNESQL